MGDEEFVELDADDAGVLGIQGVLDIDEGGEAAVALGLGDDAQTEGGLAARFRAENLDDPAARQTADAEGEVDRE